MVILEIEGEKVVMGDKYWVFVVVFKCFWWGDNEGNYMIW